MRFAQLSIRHAGVVIALWFAVVGALNLALPQLEEVIADDSTPVVPADAPAVQALELMDQEFGNGRSTSVLFVVAERDGGLTRADRRYLLDLAPRLRTDDHVSSVLAVDRRPALLDSLTSDDGESAYLQVGIPGETGAPSSIRQIEAVRDLVHEDPPAGLAVAVTGPAATIGDMATEVEHSLVRITVVTIGLIAIILMLLYRSVAVTGLILGFIGIALGAARAATAFAGLHLFAVSTFTGSFLTGVVLGAATDYAIFLISRFQEHRREGLEPREAVLAATVRIGPVVAGSALTVMLATAGMALAHIGLFHTTGPAIALGVAITLLLCLTLLPAAMLLMGERGWLDPRSRRASSGERGWARVAGIVVARPGRVLAAGLLPLILLAAFYPALDPSFDERGGQPDDTESNRGYALLAEHYPVNEALADYVLIRSDHDLRNARDLAALEQAAASAARTEGVESVRSVTRPDGTRIAQASLGYQAGRVGDRLEAANGRLRAGETGADRLVAGADQLDDGAGQLAQGADAAASGAGRLVDGVRRLHDGVSRLADGVERSGAGMQRLRDGARTLADGLATAYDQTRVAVDGLGLAHDALNHSLTCGLDPYCRRARDGIRRIYLGERDRLLPGLRRAADAARRIADGTVELDAGLARLEDGLGDAERGAAELAAGQDTMRTELGRLANGAGDLSDGTDQLSGGTERLSSSVTDLRSGLDRASSYLHDTRRVSRDPAIGGFYLPPVALDNPRFALSTRVYLSDDGHTARFVVLGATDGFGAEASDRALEVREAVVDGLRNTRLSDAEVSTTGVATLNADLAQLADEDFALVSLVTLAAVFLILLLILRSLVVALVLLASVLLSYAAAMGLGVLLWQELMGQPIEWTVPLIVFVLLVSVGADYNLLLAKRMREEAPDGSRQGIARAVTATGGVITAAGLIFACSMVAMMSGSVVTLAQMGSIIAMGLVLDTFVVRSLVVPSAAALLGPRLWGRRTVTS